MPMIPFHSLAGERAFDEMRVISVMKEGTLPPGNYGFTELYCDEDDCDCRRVIFQVRREDRTVRVPVGICRGATGPLRQISSDE